MFCAPSPGLDLLPFSVTFLLCFWEVQYGLLAGVLVSLLLLLYPVARPRLQVREVEGDPGCRGEGRKPGTGLQGQGRGRCLASLQAPDSSV